MDGALIQVVRKQQQNGRKDSTTKTALSKVKEMTSVLNITVY